MTEPDWIQPSKEEYDTTTPMKILTLSLTLMFSPKLLKNTPPEHTSLSTNPGPNPGLNTPVQV